MTTFTMFLTQYCGLMQTEMDSIPVKTYNNLWDEFMRIDDSDDATAERLSKTVLDLFAGADQVDMHDHRREPLKLKHPVKKIV